MLSFYDRKRMGRAQTVHIHVGVYMIILNRCNCLAILELEKFSDILKFVFGIFSTYTFAMALVVLIVRFLCEFNQERRTSTKVSRMLRP